ncbi:cytochrome P450 [[Kitasatospora] papulosa]|uniref:cytochrome P450 family protein n=1 Tax=[Kitasatospora] papulosa TaxID=1464011 RepID=UPI002E0E0F94|nr:cytochrome P450 [[Kitasatospora] papulosa]WSI21661.1 cytochrome P450 [[Kitasatospora] papulosa]
MTTATAAPRPNSPRPDSPPPHSHQPDSPPPDKHRPDKPETTEPRRNPPTLLSDPYPTLARMRQSAPVSVLHSDGGLRLWIIPRYTDVRAALSDHRLAQDVRRAQTLADSRVEGVNLGAEITHMLSSDPPDHTRLRRVVQAAFSRKRVQAMRPMVERITLELLDELDPAAARHTTRTTTATVDLIRDFAFPLPILVVCELLGLPPQDRNLYREWSTAIVTQEGDHTAFQQAVHEMGSYVLDIADQRIRRNDRPADLLTDLLAARERGELTDDEIVGMVALLLIGGHETTVNLLGTSCLALLRNPDQTAWLRADPTRMPMAVEEFLRYDSPICMATTRFTTQPVNIGGVEIPQDEFVLLSLGAANRDPARFQDPDRLILNRQDTGHLAFGGGIHRCLGALLGKLETEIALTALLARFPEMTLACQEHDLRWRNTMMLRGLETLPLTLNR